jgi:hypothetical protein
MQALDAIWQTTRTIPARATICNVNYPIALVAFGGRAVLY